MKTPPFANTAPRTKYILSVLFLLAVLGGIFFRPLTERLFIYEFDIASYDKKESVTESFSSILSLETMLRAVEKKYPVCHSLAHPIGKAVFKKTGDINASLAICKNACGDGCFHGVLIKLFAAGENSSDMFPGGASATSTLLKIASDAAELCKRGDVAHQVYPWRCAHGIGHVMMFSADYDITKAAKGCSRLPASIIASCISGAFMEFILNKKYESKIASMTFFPCDLFPAYANTCFFHRANSMLKANGFDSSVKSCEQLPQQQKFSCIRGLGAGLFYYNSAIVREEGRIEESCGLQDTEEQAACIDGALSRFVAVIDNSEEGCNKAAESYRARCIQKSRYLRAATF